jgi:hypothetical protein
MYGVDRTQNYVMSKQVIDIRITATALSRINPAGPLGIFEVTVSRTCDWLGLYL